MTLGDLRDYARRLTNTNSTTYTDADTLASANIWYDIMATDVLLAMDDWDFQGEIATTSLVASQQEYVFPTEILKIKSVEITYDGTNWHKASPIDISESGEPNDATSVASNFSQSKPYFDLMDNSLFLFPIPDASVANGLKIYYEKNVTQFSTSTDAPVIPRVFHASIAYGMAIDYLTEYSDVSDNKSKMASIEAKLDRMRNNMKMFYQKRNQDRDYTISPAYVDYDYD